MPEWLQIAQLLRSRLPPLLLRLHQLPTDPLRHEKVLGLFAPFMRLFLWSDNYSPA